MRSFAFLTPIVALLVISACQAPAGDETPAQVETTSQSVKAVELTNRFFNEVVNQDKTDLLDSLLHPSFHSHHYPAPPGSDKAPFIQGIKDLNAAFPDLKLTIHQQYGEGDKVFSYFTWTATHTGTFNGITATNKQVTVDGMDIWREQDGQLIENWVVMDIMGLMAQLGAVPPPAQ
ncbi:MAG TPA: ester cyclase [Saprospiraceae bacterium]|nr:ester cyclase [Saprospiraceae bacterium]